MRFFFDKTPKQRAREQLATQKERERLKRKEEPPQPYAPEPGPQWRRVDAEGVASQEAELDRLTRVSWAGAFRKMVFEFVRDHGIEIREVKDLGVPEALPTTGPFLFTVDGKHAALTFDCEHHGEGRVTFKTTATGDAEYEVDLRADWEKDLF